MGFAVLRLGYLQLNQMLHVLTVFDTTQALGTVF